MGKSPALLPKKKGQQRRSDVLVQIVIAVLLCLIYIFYALSFDVKGEKYIKGDCYYYRAVIISILHDGDFYLNNNIDRPLDSGDLALGKARDPERLVPKHPIIMPIFSLPFFAALGSIGLLIFNIMQTVLLFMVIYRLNRLFFDSGVSFAGSMLFGTVTLFFNYSFNYSPDVFSTLLFVSGLYFVLAKKYGWGAVCLGLSIFAKLPNALLVVMVCLYVTQDILCSDRWEKPLNPKGGKQKKRTLLKFFTILFIALIPVALANTVLYGSPWTTGYSRAFGMNDHLDTFNQPLVKGFVRQLFDGEKGLLTTNPILLVSLLGLFIAPARRFRIPFDFIFLLCLAQLLFFAKYDYWRASHFSNRFLMITVALLSVFASSPIAFLANKLKDRKKVLS